MKQRHRIYYTATQNARHALLQAEGFLVQYYKINNKRYFEVN